MISDMGKVHAMIRLASLHLMKLQLGVWQFSRRETGLIEVEVCYVKVLRVAETSDSCFIALSSTNVLLILIAIASLNVPKS